MRCFRQWPSPCARLHWTPSAPEKQCWPTHAAARFALYELCRARIGVHCSCVHFPDLQRSSAPMACAPQEPSRPLNGFPPSPLHCPAQLLARNSGRIVRAHSTTKGGASELERASPTSPCEALGGFPSGGVELCGGDPISSFAAICGSMGAAAFAAADEFFSGSTSIILIWLHEGAHLTHIG